MALRQSIAVIPSSPCLEGTHTGTSDQASTFCFSRNSAGTHTRCASLRTPCGIPRELAGREPLLGPGRVEDAHGPPLEDPNDPGREVANVDELHRVRAVARGEDVAAARQAHRPVGKRSSDPRGRR